MIIIGGLKMRYLKQNFMIFFLGAFGGIIGGTIIVLLMLKFSINWTAIACITSIIALIITTRGNRKRFEKDAEMKLKVANANELMGLISEFLVVYRERLRLMTVVLRRRTNFDASQMYKEKTSELARELTDTVFRIKSVISKIDMVYVRIEKDIAENNLFILFSKIDRDDDAFFKSIQPQTLLGYGLEESEVQRIVKEQCQMRADYLEKEIRNIQEQSAKLFNELTTLK